MKRRVPVYSASRPAPAQPAAPAKKRAIPWRRLKLPALVAALALAAGGLWLAQPRSLGEQDIRSLVQQAIEAQPAKPTAAEAYERIRPSVVGVRASGDDTPEDAMEVAEEKAKVQRGTGVVIVDSGLILTNLHVVQGAKRVHVTFFDGTDAEAEMVGARPEHDLAVLQPKTLPDDLQPATMRSTQGLRPGEEVLAVGYPFGIGPSASAGVVSGLKRDYVSPEGKRVLTNLIQFDAAVNPGNSGGPLVTLDGEVVGIVTGLLNPTEQRVFIGIGFAVPIENAAGAIGLSPF
jgi:S1-C subfamily serine protease